jgi:hypothetical protein
MKTKLSGKVFLFLCISLLVACGGSSGGSSGGSDDPETSNKCVLGTSTLGDCTI